LWQCWYCPFGFVTGQFCGIVEKSKDGEECKGVKAIVGVQGYE
jgi:hypothetical protein